VKWFWQVTKLAIVEKSVIETSSIPLLQDHCQQLPLTPYSIGEMVQLARS
jgi:hypothetical protein